MRKLGLTHSERLDFHRALRASHTRRISVQLMTLDGDPRGNLSDRVLDGQVIVDADAEVTRVCTLSLLDPDRSLNFDSDAPDDGALYLDRMIRVAYAVRVDTLTDRWVRVPVFTGPVTRLDRTGAVIEVEAQGMESLAMGATWRPLTIKKGTPKTHAIRTIMRDRAGETRFDLPDLRTRLPQTVSLDRYGTPWSAAQKIARSMDRQLFYTGAGRLELRRHPVRPVFTFRDGDGGDIVSPVGISHAQDRVRNTVVVVGGKPKGRKDRVRAQAVAPNGHPLSPARLGRTTSDGRIPRHLVERIEDSAIRSQREANDKAERKLADLLREAVTAEFDVLPVPHLDPLDLVRAETSEFGSTFRLRQFTIPLGAGDSAMSIGYLRKTAIRRGRIR